MAKRNVQSLLDKITAESQKDSNVRSIVDKKVHIYSIDIKNLGQQLIDQIEGKYSRKDSQKIVLSEDQKKKVIRAGIVYFNNIKNGVTDLKDKFNVYTIFSGPTSIKLRIESKKGGNSSVFTKFIGDVRREPLNKLRAEIYEILKDSSIMGRDIKDRILGTGEKTGGLLDPGHTIGTSITANRINKYILELDTMSKVATASKTKGTNPVINLSAIVKNNPRLQDLKTIDFSIVYVSEQGVDQNRITQRVQEQILISSVKKQLTNALQEVDWGNFTSSSSVNDMAIHRILSTAKKGGAKVKNLKSLDTKGTKASSTIKQTVEKTNTNDVGVNVSIKSPNIKPEKSTNWLSLLPIINAKLAPRVMANMKRPALVNRTGTFANSAQVVNIEQTREGFPSFVFDYERNPYDVFDRTKGASPWNTPERDPRALVDKSLREIVREMAIGRFYTRRA